MRRTESEILNDLKDFLSLYGLRYEIVRTPNPRQSKTGTHYEMNWVITVSGTYKSKRVPQRRFQSYNLGEIESNVKDYISDAIQSRSK